MNPEEARHWQAVLDVLVAEDGSMEPMSATSTGLGRRTTEVLAAWYSHKGWAAPNLTPVERVTEEEMEYVRRSIADT